jgi:hypothetical protein
MSFSSVSLRLVLLSLIVFSSMSAKYRKTYTELYEDYKVAKSACTFHASILYNKLWFGRAFSFNPVMGGTCATDAKDAQLCVCVSEAGKIVGIHDGKKNLLLLGSIPRYKEHVAEIKKRANLSENDKIGFYTLNRDFECSWFFSGLAELEKTEPIISHKYPTTDYSSPSFIDLLRAVRDLENRDHSEEKIAYVHCKAGRGRSAAVVSAYLMHVCNKAGINATSKQIEEYLRSRRERISMNSEQHQILELFACGLKAAGNFEKLYAQYKGAAEKRDQEFEGKAE